MDFMKAFHMIHSCLQSGTHKHPPNEGRALRSSVCCDIRAHNSIVLKQAPGEQHWKKRKDSQVLLCRSTNRQSS